MDNDALSWTVRAYHGSDEARTPSEGGKSRECSACRVVRGSEDSPKSVDNWPDERMSDRGPPSVQTGEPQAEPSNEISLPSAKMVTLAGRPATAIEARPIAGGGVAPILGVGDRWGRSAEGSRPAFRRA